MYRARKIIAGLIRPWIAEFVIWGILPERIGKYRVLDILLWLEESQNKYHD